MIAKIGQPEHMLDLVLNGTVYMQRLSAYKWHEDNIRGDKNEALAMRFDGANPTLRTSVTIGNKTIPLHSASMVIHSRERDHGVYCMYGFTVPTASGPFPTYDLLELARDRRLRFFGNAMVVFPNTQEFARRLHRAACNAEYALEGRSVEYVPMDYCGDVGPFRKLESYEYQSEYRFVTTMPIPETSLVLKLGSLRDIAVLMDLSDVPLEPTAPGQS